MAYGYIVITFDKYLENQQYWDDISNKNKMPLQLVSNNEFVIPKKDAN